MRTRKELIPTRYNQVKTSGSNKFVSTFSQLIQNDGIVEKRDRTYNWINYKLYIKFTIVIGSLTYFVIDYLWF